MPAIDISVCVPTYNRASMLPAAIESALPQLAPNDELLILDNHSTDTTQELLKSYTDPRIRVIRNPSTVNVYENHNCCIQHARGKWLVFLHSDDRLLPQALATLRSLAQTHPQATVFHAAAEESNRLPPNTKSLSLSGPTGIVSLMRWQMGGPSGKMYLLDGLLRAHFKSDIDTADLILLGELLSQGGNILIVAATLIDVGRGKFQGTHKWQLTGQSVRDFANTFDLFLKYPQVEQELLKEMKDWSDIEISECLMFLAHGGHGQLIQTIEKSLGNRRSYRNRKAYRHVRIYRMAGLKGLKMSFGVVKKILAIKRK